MRDKIAEIISENPKHYSRIIKSDSEMKQWIEDNALIVAPFPEMVYSVIHQENPTCENGNKRKFIGINDGFRPYCGMTADCLCAQKGVGKKVSDIKSKRTQEEIAAENTKREQTSFERYGVTNNGQTDYAREKHTEFYADQEKITRAVEAQQRTLQEKYGVNNARQIHISKESLEILNDKDRFVEFLNTRNSTVDILEELGVSGFMFYSRLDKFDSDWKSLGHHFKSKAELEILDFINRIYDGQVISGDRTQIYPNELDIFVPMRKLAIEYCGLYWHSDKQKEKNYHLKKFNACQEKGIKLLTIFEDEWKFKKDIVKHRILNALGINDSSIYARKCEVKSLSNKDANRFIEQWHLQGKCNAKIALGLFFGDELISVMTFSKSRFNQNYDYELIRFCSSKNVVGAGSKMFAWFVKTYQPNSVVSYSDNRWGNGKLYVKMGFEKDDKPMESSYCYTDYQSRFNRQKFQKHKLVKEGYDSSKSEAEIMRERGFAKIYDCGQTTWKWNN